LISKILEKGQYQNGYTTSVIIKTSFDTHDLFHIVETLYKTLDSRSVVGHTQRIFLDYNTDFEPISYRDDEFILRQIEYAMKEQKWERLRSEFTKLMQIWQKDKRPQLFIERYVRQIFYFIQSRYANILIDDYEFMLEDAFFYATTMEELTDSLLDIFYKNMQDEVISWLRADTKEFMNKIKEYLRRHMSETITLQSVCKEFGISQTYLSKLFRKYEDKSFNNYLTAIRIEYAKKLMKENREFFIKDIAAMVGYNDQFYFSRVFCSMTGTPPSVYAEKSYCDNDQSIKMSQV
jgi:two-component system, response regulator YesN